MACTWEEGDSKVFAEVCTMLALAVRSCSCFGLQCDAHKFMIRD